MLTILPGFVKTKMTAKIELPDLLTAPPRKVAAAIYRAIRKKKNVIYSYKIWRLIMLVIKFIPESIFKKMNL